MKKGLYDSEMPVFQHATCVFFLQWPDGAAVKAAQAASAPATGCRRGLSAGAMTTAPHLDDRRGLGRKRTVTIKRKKVQKKRKDRQKHQRIYVFGELQNNILDCRLPHNNQDGCFWLSVASIGTTAKENRQTLLFLLETRLASFALALSLRARLLFHFLFSSHPVQFSLAHNLQHQGLWVWPDRQLMNSESKNRVSVHSTVYCLQLIVPQVERDQLGLGAQAQRWRPLQAVVSQVQVLQFAQGLRDGEKANAMWLEKGRPELMKTFEKKFYNLKEFCTVLNLVVAQI